MLRVPIEGSDEIPGIIVDIILTTVITTDEDNSKAN
jgi:hypothetical protein